MSGSHPVGGNGRLVPRWLLLLPLVSLLLSSAAPTAAQTGEAPSAETLAELSRLASERVERLRDGAAGPSYAAIEGALAAVDDFIEATEQYVASGSFAALSADERRAVQGPLQGFRYGRARLLLRLDRCAEADAALDALLAEAELPAGLRGEAEGARTSAAVCSARAEVSGHVAAAAVAGEGASSGASSPSAAGPEPTPGAGARPGTPVPPPAEGVDVAALTTLCVGGALLLATGIYDGTLQGDRDEFSSLQSACAAGAEACDYDRALALQGTLDDARWITGVGYGVGAAAVITGVVLWVVEGDETNVAIGPRFDSNELGATVWARF